MKKKNKKKKFEIHLEQIELSRGTKIASYLFFGTIGVLALFILIGAFSQHFSIFLWKYLLLPVQTFVYSFSQYIIVKIGPIRAGGFLLLIPTVLLVDFISRVVGSSKSIPKKKRHKIFNVIQTGLYIFITFMVIYMFYGVFGSQNNPKLDTMFFPQEVDNVYTEEDLWKLNQYLEDKVIEFAHKMDRTPDGKMIDIDYVEQARSDLANASKKYWTLRGNYPKKLYYFDDYDLSHDPSCYGLTTIDVVGLYKDQEAPELLNTITHEMCHTKGIIRENEATLCSVIVGLESDNPISQYSAYLEAYSRSVDALSLIDSKKILASTKRVQQLCIDNHYTEICNNGFKLTKLYVHKSDKFMIQTFSLKQYPDHTFIKDFLKEIKDYSPELYIEENKIKEKDLDSYFDKDVFLTIEFKNSKKIFNDVKDSLEKYKEDFFNIDQNYPGKYVGVEMEKEEAIEYYTSSIPDSNITILFQPDKRAELFDYSRVVRLILEYFDAENISYLS